MSKYHMRKSEREITAQEDLLEILKNGKYVVISLCRNNEPYIVTLSYGYDVTENALYFHSGREGLKLEFIRENPNVCATVIEDLGYIKDDCAHAYKSVVIFGKIIEITELNEKKKGMEVLLNHLEENPNHIKEKQLRNDAVYNNMLILKLEIDEMTGKKGK